MPDFWELVETNWPFIAAHPWLFIKWSVFWLIVGLLVGRKLVSSGGQAAATMAPHSATPQPAKFQYPERGLHGPNVLSNRTTSVRSNEGLSFAAVVPVGESLRIVLEGPPHPKQPDMFNTPGWGASVMGAKGWKMGDRTRTASGGHRQVIDAAAGPAEMGFNFMWPGDVTLSAYQGDSHNASWVHKIRVTS